MPITAPTNSLYKIKELQVDCDRDGYYLSMNPSHATACVVCISRQPVSRGQLSLSDNDLKRLHSGAKLDSAKEGYVLQGITRQQFSAAALYRGFRLDPPAYVQVWGMSSDTELCVPDDPEEQCCLVPVMYEVIENVDSFAVVLDHMEGYQDGDLMYQVGSHKPIPIPKSRLNQQLPMRPGVQAVVTASPAAGKQYIRR